MPDNTWVPIQRRQALKPIEESLPEKKVLGSRAGSSFNSIRVAKTVKLRPNTQSYVEVTSKTQGLRIIEGRSDLWEKKKIATASGIAEVTPDKKFLVQVANFSKRVVTLQKGERLGTSLPVPIPVSSAEAQVADEEYGENHGYFDINSVPSPFREIWDSISTITFEGEENPVPETCQVDPEAAQEAEVKEPSFEDIGLDHLSSSRRKAVEAMAKPFKSLWKAGLGKIKATVHRLNLEEGSRPSYAQPYRAGPEKRRIIEQEIEKMLDMGVIEPTVSEWAAPVVLAPKPGGKWRFCVDYRKLNAMTKREVYPLPRLEDCIDSLGEAKWFSTLDANCGYWQIEMDENDKPKTAFTAHCGTYRYTRMPFGLKNAPATFQRALDLILAGYRWQSCIVYIDDVIVFSQSFEEHLEHVRDIFKALSAAGVTLKPSKCHLFAQTVDYLGHKVSPGRLEVAIKNTEPLKKCLYPSTQSHLRSFLGLCNVYRRFVPNFARTAAPT